jgi:predicted AlkP superfamily phosphohydrolase/phosphomutase
MNSIQTDSGDDNATTTASTPQPKDTTKDTRADDRAAKRKRAAAERRAAEQSELGQAREVGASDTLPSWVGAGGGPRRRRLLLVGLAGATPELVLGAWRTELRTIAMLTERGLRGRLSSSVPWNSVPAWQCLLSGQDPGRLGIYGAERRLNHSYTPPVPIDSHAPQAPRLWDLLGRAGYSVGVVGAPATTPAPRVQGHLIGDRLGSGAPAIYPASLGRQVELWLADDSPAPPASGDEIDLVVGRAYARTEQRFRLARRLLARNTYDCFVICDDGIASVQNALWHTLDVTHLRYVAQHPFVDAISAFYRFVDDQIGELLELVDDDTVIAVAAPNGTQSLDGELALNEWLIAEGELRVLARPPRPTSLAECEVDWARTRAWAGDSGALFLNLAGREPQGSVAPEQAEALLAGLAERLSALAVPEPSEHSGAPALQAHRPPAIYSATHGIAPDLLVQFSQAGWRPNAAVGYGAPWLSTRTAALDAACESPRGLVVLYDPRAPAGGRELAGATIYDLVPTCLALFGEPLPARLRGRSFLDD